MKLIMFRATHGPSSGALKLHWQPLVFHTWKVVGRVGGGRCQAHCAWQQPSTYENPEAASAVLGRLMMGVVSPETCWASYKYGVIKFCYIVASCWIFLCEFTCVSSRILDYVQGECKQSGEKAVTVLITFAASCGLCEIQYEPITNVACDKRVTVVSKAARF